MKLAFGNDHAATEIKQQVIDYLESLGHEVVNCGTDSSESTDYPIYAKRVADLVASKQVDGGVLICGTGEGIGMAANKVDGIRCCICSEPESVKLSREHNDCNCVAFGARIIDVEMMKKILDAFLNTPFSNGERHIRRIQMLHELEK
ncbi:MAG: ribose 5-phosphate isomerase B [Erysipelotrichaceae bacterium]|jgi:ribose 5-phosphate isomerase B|nr:ribose 5-phosphate isomerase B [Erysipelotrichaceae bacterium]MBR2809655.1 ribose 5-phosphate isomerase B [Erysipelotrichaceae bacterium]